jgi:hypothetical protein
MSAERFDGKLADLQVATERISANLLELELDPDRRYVDGTTLSGASGQRFEEAEATIAELWLRRELLEQTLERCRRLRRHGRLSPQARDELGAILDGPSIPLAGDTVGIADRHLLADPTNTVMVSPSELLDLMSESFDAAKLSFARIADAMKIAMPALRAAQDRIADAAVLADRLGARSLPELLAAEAELGALADRVLHDPLTVEADEVASLARSAETINARLADMATLSEQIAGRIEGARAQLADLRALARDGAAAHDALRARTTADAPAPIEIARELDAQLDHVAQLARAGDWPGAHDAMALWTRSFNELAKRAHDVLSSNRAPLETRDQLRGLLEAYRAKAARLGVIEDPELAEIFARARDALFIAPTDLDEARELVRSAQHSVLLRARHSESEIAR